MVSFGPTFYVNTDATRRMWRTACEISRLWGKFKKRNELESDLSIMVAVEKNSPRACSLGQSDRCTLLVFDQGIYDGLYSP